MSHVHTKERLKKRLTRLTSPFTGPSSSPQLGPELQDLEPKITPIIKRTVSDSSISDSVLDSASSSESEIQRYYAGSTPNLPTIIISKPSTRSSNSSSSIDFNYPPLRGPKSNGNGSVGSSNGAQSASMIPSGRYLSANGTDHAFLLSHGKPQSSNQLQMPIPVQTASHSSTNSTSSSSRYHNKANSANGIMQQTTLPTIGPIHQNGSLNSLPISMMNPIANDGSVITTKSSSRISNPSRSAVSLSIPSRKTGSNSGSGGGGLLRKRNGSNALSIPAPQIKKKIIVHNHSHHLPLRCPHIKMEFLDLEQSFDHGIESKIQQISTENELIIEEVNKLSLNLDKLCSQLQDQINELDNLLIELDSKSSILNEVNNTCMLEDMNDLINRIDLVTLNINEKKGSIKEINKQLNVLQELKKNKKVSNVKRRKWFLFAGGLLTLFVINYVFF